MNMTLVRSLVLGWLTALILVVTVVLSQAGPAEGGGAKPEVSAGTAQQSGGSRTPFVVPKPRIRRMLVPFGSKRKRQMARYSKRHYGSYRWRLRRPKVIVQHLAGAGTLGSIYNTFVTNRPDPELGELPNVCAHYAISPSGRIYQFVKLRIRCRHAIGLNHVAIGVEHVGFRDGDVLSRRRQLRASLRLSKWLRCTQGISVKNVIGHAESLSSRFYRERIEWLRGQTHGDFRRPAMRVYRKKLRRAGRCFPPERLQAERIPGRSG